MKFAVFKNDAGNSCNECEKVIFFSRETFQNNMKTNFICLYFNKSNTYSHFANRVKNKKHSSKIRTRCPKQRGAGGGGND